MDLQKYFCEESRRMFLGKKINIDTEDFSCTVVVISVEFGATLISLTAENEVCSCKIQFRSSGDKHQFDLYSWKTYKIDYNHKNNNATFKHLCDELDFIAQ